MDDERGRTLTAYLEAWASNQENLADVVELVARERLDVIDAVLDELQEHAKAGVRVHRALEAELASIVWQEFLDEHPELEGSGVDV